MVNIEEVFTKNEPDYGRKLFLIENCIYGVDIQPAAIQISKLRFFISLVADQRIRPAADNLGIPPLPNLETKFVAANTLLGIEKPAQSILHDENLRHAVEAKERELKIVRERHFTARTARIKEKYRRDDERLRLEICKLLEVDQWPPETTAKLIRWNPYDQNSSANFFDAGWMFNLPEGFDVVIGNPPYGLLNKRQNKHQSITATGEEIEYYKSAAAYAPASGGMLNVYRLFVIKSINLLRRGGFLSEILPLAFTGDVSAANLRRYILDHCRVRSIEAFPERDNENKRVFEAVKMSVCILNLERVNAGDSEFFIRISGDRFVDVESEKVFLGRAVVEAIDRTNYTIPLLGSSDLSLLQKVYENASPLARVGHCYTGEIDLTIGRKYLTDNSSDAVLIKGAIIDRYSLRKKMSQGEIKFINAGKYSAENRGKKASHHQVERIVMQAITGVNEKLRLKMTLIDGGIYCANSVNYVVLEDDRIDLKYLLGILNSKLLNFVFSRSSTNSNVNGYEVDNLPIKLVNARRQAPLSKLVEQILATRRKTPDADTCALEQEIERLVYQLYELTPGEIALVEACARR